MNDGDSDYTHLMRCCDRLGIPDARVAVGKMLTLDYIIANEDRHYTNFGFVRNAETLAWFDAAPVFDSGTSLWHNALSVGEPRKCQPFAKTHEEQIKLVSDLSWFNAGTLKGLEQEISEIFSQSRTVDESRAKAIGEAVLNRADAIGRLAKSKSRTLNVPVQKTEKTSALEFIRNHKSKERTETKTPANTKKKSYGRD